MDFFRRDASGNVNGINAKTVITPLVIIFLLVLANPIVIIRAGQRGVVSKFGAVSEKVMEEGINFRIPFYEQVKKMDVKTTKKDVTVAAASKDLQNIESTIALNYHLDPVRVNKLIQEVGIGYDARIIDPAVQEAVKSAMAKYTAEELITKRQEVKEEIKSTLLEQLNKVYIMVDEVSIVNFNFSDSFNSAIEAKVTAEQNALAAQNKLEQVKFEAEQRIASAEAEAEAIRIQAQSISAQGGAAYVKLKWVEAWQSGGANVPQFITSEQAGNFIFDIK